MTQEEISEIYKLTENSKTRLIIEEHHNYCVLPPNKPMWEERIVVEDWKGGPVRIDGMNELECDRPSIRVRVEVE